MKRNIILDYEKTIEIGTENYVLKPGMVININIDGNSKCIYVCDVFRANDKVITVTLLKMSIYELSAVNKFNKVREFHNTKYRNHTSIKYQIAVCNDLDKLEYDLRTVNVISVEYGEEIDFFQ